MGCKALFCLIFLVACTSLPDTHINQTSPQAAMQHIYVPIGDSYTVGTGVSPNESWPFLLTEHLQAERVPIRMPANPAQDGWTTQQAIALELPVMRRENATFSTLLIGANDIVQGVSAEQYRKNVQILLDALSTQTQGRTLVITMPDFTRTPAGSQFEEDKQRIIEFNAIMKEEASRRNLPIFDLYTETERYLHELSIETSATADPLHPSAEEHYRWEAWMYSQVRQLLS